MNNLLWELLPTGYGHHVSSFRFVSKIEIYIIFYFSVISFFSLLASLGGG